MQTTKNRKFPPVGNSLLYISLLSVAFGRVRPIQGRTLFFVLFYINGLVRCVSRSVVARDPAKHYKVAHGIAANAVAAMHTAGSFASGIQTGDRISLRIKNLCICVDLQATHGMMDARCDFDRVIGCSRQVSVHTVVAAKLLVLACCHRCVPSIHRFHKVLDGIAFQSHCFCQILVVVGRNGQAIFNILLAGLQIVHNTLVKNNIGVCARLLQFRIGNSITGSQIVAETLAFSIDQNTAHAAHAL